MDFQHFNVKIFVEGELTVDLQRFIEVFHSWVAEQSMDEMMIDIADYRHVPAGPGVLMVGLEADYSIDHNRSRFGLRYNRKAPLEGNNQDRLRQAYQAAASACTRLEAEFAELKFSRRELEVFVNDRALAPNTEEARDQLRTEIDTFVRDQLGQADCEAQFNADPRQLLGAVVTLSNVPEADLERPLVLA